MKYLEQLAWIACQYPGCESGRAIDSRHLDNVTASGGLDCLDHSHEVPC